MLVVARFIDTDAPDDDGGTVAIAAHHIADVVDDYVLPVLIAEISPTGRLLPDHQTQFVAGVQKCGGLRIVGAAYDVAVEVVAQDFGVAALHAVGHRISDIGEQLVPVQPEELKSSTVEEEPIHIEMSFTKSNAGSVIVNRLIVVVEGYYKIVEMRCGDVP